MYSDLLFDDATNTFQATAKLKCNWKGKNRVFSNDVTAAILVFQTDPVVVELFLLLQEIWIDAGHQSENAP